MIIEQYLQTFRGKIIFNLEFYTQPHYQSSILYSKEKKKKEGVNQKVYGSQEQGINSGEQLRKVPR